ncbi:ABC transporter substrate-binding protein [Kiloniella litopenaei]|uniref:ABC transporter substrate-binding protein n=1 Tax=Kiloniella litopenaei TaxID=1549748 RepID=A0A0M2R2J4_9PROT|nr:ABC transporter substrate-binding protein [Kiloniella litopenaei]KKJ76112.1 ABC transporter substrate-binding protein [Kiloniella litopenaei]
MKIKNLLKGLAFATAVSVSALSATATYAGTPDNVLVIANRIDDITSLDPHDLFEFAGSDYSNNVYDKLVTFDPADLSKGYQPGLAESWTISEDGKTFTFKIAKGRKFHSGNDITAHDAEYSLRRAVVMKKTPSFILTQFGFDADNVETTIKATDDYTLVVTTDKKYAPSFVLNCFAAVVSSIVDSKLVQSHEVDGDWGNKWLQTNSAGSGAYSLINWKPNESYRLKVNADYWAAKPTMKSVIVRHIPESATQRLLLEKGDIDVARNLNPTDVEGISSNSDLAVDNDLRGRIMYISMNQKDPILSKPKVREALRYLIDYDGMVNSFLKGQYVVHQAFLPLTYMGELKDKPFKLDMAKGKKLLAEAGHADGFDVEIIVRNAQERIQIAQSIQNTFKQAGINVSLTQGTGKQILGKYRARDFQIYVGAWGPDYPDPHTNADTFASNPDNRDEAKLTGKLAWRNSWDIPEMTAMTVAAAQETDGAKRAQMYIDIQKEHQMTSPFVEMFQKNEQTGRQANVQGFYTGSAVSQVVYWTVTK